MLGSSPPRRATCPSEGGIRTSKAHSLPIPHHLHTASALSARPQEPEEWSVVAEGRKGGRGFAKLCRALEKVLDDLYLSCELDCNHSNVVKLLHYLKDSVDDFQELERQIARITRVSKPVAWEVRPYRRADSRSPHKHLVSGEASGTDTPDIQLPSSATREATPLPTQGEQAASGSRPGSPMTQRAATSSLHPSQQPTPFKAAGEEGSGTPAGYASGCSNSPKEGGLLEPLPNIDNVAASAASSAITGANTCAVGVETDAGVQHPQLPQCQATHTASTATAQQRPPRLTLEPAPRITLEPESQEGSSPSEEAGPSGSQMHPANTHVDFPYVPSPCGSSPILCSPGGSSGCGMGSIGRQAGPHRAMSIGGASSGGLSVDAWKEKVNWPSVFAQKAPNLTLALRSGASEEGQLADILRSKLRSPGRKQVRTPQEAKAVVEEKQARAERLRVALAEERLARLARAKESREKLRSAKEERKGAIQSRFEEKIARSEQLRQAHLAAVAFRAGDEARKVAEVAWMAKMLEEERKLSLQQKLEEGEARRRELMEEKLAKQKEAAAAAEGAAERRRAAEELRQAELTEKARKKELAQLARLAKQEEERRAAAAARESAKEAQARLAEQMAAAKKMELAARSSKIEERMREAAVRRAQHLEMIKERAALGAAVGPVSSFSSLVAAAATQQAGAADAAMAGLGRLRVASDLAHDHPSSSASNGSGGAASPRSPRPLHLGTSGHSHGHRRMQDLLAHTTIPQGPAGTPVNTPTAASGAGSGGGGVDALQPLTSGDRSVTGASSAARRLKGMRKRAGKLAGRLHNNRFEIEAPPAWQRLLSNYDGPGPSLMARWRALIAACGTHPGLAAAHGIQQHRQGGEGGAQVLQPTHTQAPCPKDNGKTQSRLCETEQPAGMNQGSCQAKQGGVHGVADDAAATSSTAAQHKPKASSKRGTKEPAGKAKVSLAQSTATPTPTTTNRTLEPTPPVTTPSKSGSFSQQPSTTPLPPAQHGAAMHAIISMAAADLARPSTHTAALAAAAPSGLLALLCAEVASCATLRPVQGSPALSALQLLLGLLQAPDNADALLANNLGLGFVRAAMHSLDRANGSEGVGPLDGEELEAKYLAYILQVLICLCKPMQHTVASPAQPGNVCAASRSPSSSASTFHHPTSTKPAEPGSQPARTAAPGTHPKHAPAPSQPARGSPLDIGAREELPLGPQQPSRPRAAPTAHAEAPAQPPVPQARLRVMRQHLVGYMVACGLIHRASELFTLCDQPISSSTSARAASPSRTAPGSDSAFLSPSGPPPISHQAWVTTRRGSDTGAAAAARAGASGSLHTTATEAGEAVPPIPLHVLQALNLLEAMTTPVPDVEGGASNSKSVQHTTTAASQLLPNKQWSPKAANAASLSLALQETAMAGLPMLLTAVLLNAAPSCTPAEARPEALPPNFVCAATLVMRIFNNLARLDLPALQSGLADSNQCVGFCHLVAFLLSYATNAWQPHLSLAVLHAALHPAPLATALPPLASIRPPPGPAPRPVVGAAATAAGPAGRARPPVHGAAAAAARRVHTTGRGHEGRRGAAADAAVTPARGGLQAGVAAGARQVPVTSTDGSYQGAGGEGRSGVGGGGPTDEEAAVGIVALLNEVMVLIGYFAVLAPSCQEMLAWGSASSTIITRLVSTPLAYLTVPQLAQVLLPTLAAVCYGDTRLCDLAEQRVSPEFVWRMLAQHMSLRGGQAQGEACASAAVEGGVGLSNEVGAGAAHAREHLSGAVKGGEALTKAVSTAQGWGVVRPVWHHAWEQRLPNQVLEEVCAFFAARVERFRGGR